MSDWERIVNEHGPAVFRISSRILGQRQDAEDVAQEVFCEAYQVHRAGRVESWPALLRRLAVLRSIDQLRRRRKTVGLSPANLADSRGNPANHVANDELVDRLREALAELPQQQAAVFSMRYFDLLSNGEISESLRISVSAVSTALSKARTTLNRQLAHLIRGGTQ